MRANVRSSLRHRARGALTGPEWRTVAAMAAVVIGLHVVGFFILIAVIAPRHYQLGATGSFTVGLGVTAYMLGLRHAFDADHIAAIDNTTRKLMVERKRPLGVGFFFSLGHSTIVFLLALLFAVGIRAVSGQVREQHVGASQRHELHRHRGIRQLPLPDRCAQPARLIQDSARPARNATGRFRRGATRAPAQQPRRDDPHLWSLHARRHEVVAHVPLGMLFGLGFDTATEVALLFLAAGAAGAGLPFYAILCLPILFAAGMSLLDTIDGSFMNFAYGWAFSNPVRKIYYNITITGLSVAVALDRRHGRAAGPRRRQARAQRRVLELDLRDRHQRGRLHDRRVCSS